jgi:hypothetical protein
MLLLSALSLAIVTAGRAEAAQPQDEVRHWVELFNTSDSMAKAQAHLDFHEKVLPPRRAPLLHEMWLYVAGRPERVTVRAAVLGYLMQPPRWEPQARDLVTKASHDNDSQLRRLALTTFVSRGEAEAQQDILAFLKDPDDELRDLTILSIWNWPEAPKIMADYAKANAKARGHEKSISRAMLLLKRRSETAK